MEKVEMLKDYDENTVLYSVGWGFFAKRGKKVTRIFKDLDSLLFLLNYGTIRWQSL